MRGKELLTKSQRQAWMDLSELIESKLATYYTFSPDDIKVIDRHPRDHNRLGFAVQLCLLRYPGWSLTDMRGIPEKILNYIAKQIQVDQPKKQDELQKTNGKAMNEKVFQFADIGSVLIQARKNESDPCVEGKRPI